MNCELGEEEFTIMTTSTKKANEVDAAIGRRIREARVARHLSQEALGAAMGVTFQQIQKVEKGANRLPASRIALVAGALGVSQAYLLGIGEEAGSGGPAPFIVDRATRRIAAAMPCIKRREAREALATLAELVAGQ